MPSIRRRCVNSCSTKKTPRATKLRSIFASSLSALTVLVANIASAQEGKPASAPASRPVVTVSAEAMAIHGRSYVFDGHNDLPWVVRTDASRSFDSLDISKPQPKIHTDIPRLKTGGVGAQFWSVYVPADTAKTGAAHQTTIEQIEIVKAMIARYPETSSSQPPATM